jgi:hypothetical protein
MGARHDDRVRVDGFVDDHIYYVNLIPAESVREGEGIKISLIGFPIEILSCSSSRRAANAAAELFHGLDADRYRRRRRWSIVAGGDIGGQLVRLVEDKTTTSSIVVCHWNCILA